MLGLDDRDLETIRAGKDLKERALASLDNLDRAAQAHAKMAATFDQEGGKALADASKAFADASKLLGGR